MKFSLLSITLFLITQLTINAETGRYRLSWRDAPTSTMVIGWESINGNSTTVYYDTVDHGDNIDAYEFQKGYDRSVDTKGMTNQFARLTGLLPDTAYYFIIVDSNSVSSRYWFKTAADSHKPFSVVAGGDSRNNREPRKNANLIVSKVRPLFVSFGGDYTNTDNNIQ